MARSLTSPKNRQEFREERDWFKVKLEIPSYTGPASGSVEQQEALVDFSLP